MHYKFPYIETIDDVRQAIEGVDGFIIAERDWGYVCNYLVLSPDSFPPVSTSGGSAKMREQASRNKAIRRECRGIIFCKKTGRITRRPLHKFWNINERDETQFDKLDFSGPHYVYTKLDGSMLVPFEIEYGSGIIRWGTKMGAGTDVAMAAEVFVADHPQYHKFAEWCIKRELTPIFEFTSPGKYKIVVDYDQPMLTLLAVRHMLTGEYVAIENSLQDVVNQLAIPVVQTHDPITSPAAFLQSVKMIEGSEGVIVAWPDGHRIKCKGDWYVSRHKAKDKILRENGLIELMLDEKLDDVKPVLSNEDRHRLEDFENIFWEGINHTSKEWLEKYRLVRTAYKNNRKGFALSNDNQNMDGLLRSTIFKAWDVPEFDWRDAIIAIVRRHLGTGVKVNEVRHLWGGQKWEYTATTGDS